MVTTFPDFEQDFVWYETADSLYWLDSPDILILPWWMREQTGHSNMSRGWFTESYPMLFPYYPIASMDSNWIGVWDPMLHGGYWWI